MQPVDPAISSFVNILLSLSITAVIPVLASIAWKWIQSHESIVKNAVSADQYNQFRATVEMVVQAAEKSGLSKLIQDTAQGKKTYAINALQAIVDANGWNIPVAQIEAEIEAAVLAGVHQEPAPAEHESVQGVASGIEFGDEDDDSGDIDTTVFAKLKPQMLAKYTQKTIARAWDGTPLKVPTVIKR